VALSRALADSAHRPLFRNLRARETGSVTWQPALLTGRSRPPARASRGGSVIRLRFHTGRVEVERPLGVLKQRQAVDGVGAAQDGNRGLAHPNAPGEQVPLSKYKADTRNDSNAFTNYSEETVENCIASMGSLPEA